MGIKKTLKKMSASPETRTLLELYVGIIVWGLIILVIGLIFARPMWKYIVGVVIGVVATMLQLYNMYDTIDRALGTGEERARGYMTLKSVFRLFVYIAVMLLAYSIGLTAFVGTVLGLFSLKLSALVNPLVKKLLPDFQ